MKEDGSTRGPAVRRPHALGRSRMPLRGERFMTTIDASKTGISCREVR
jgi:hypothetical protein